jgi:hypothetical protein
MNERGTVRAELEVKEIKLVNFHLWRFPMKIVALEEHYGLPVIYEAAHKANDRVALAYDVLKKRESLRTRKAGFQQASMI